MYWSKQEQTNEVHLVLLFKLYWQEQFIINISDMQGFLFLCVVPLKG